MNCDIFIPVRLNNTRFPKKAMRELYGKPIIKYLIERLQKSTKIRNIVVCTTKQDLDNPLVEYLNKEGMMVFRGSEKDVLARFLEAAERFGTEVVINVDGDDIYSDPVFVDKLVNEFEQTSVDYVSFNGYPLGFAPVGFRTSALRKICELKKTDNTETGYRQFFVETKIFNVKHIPGPQDLQFPNNIRLTLDYQEDFDLACIIFRELGKDFHLEDIIKLFAKKPQLLKITEGLDARWKEHWNKNLADFSVTSK